MAAEPVDISKLQKQLDKYVEAAGADHRRFVIHRHGSPVAALVSGWDLERLANWGGNKGEDRGAPGEWVNISVIRTSFSTYVGHAEAGSRYLIRNSRPQSTANAGLIGTADLRVLEELDDPAGQEKKRRAAADRDEKLRGAFEQAGVVVSWPTGEPIPQTDRALIQLRPGEQPLSEQIIAERR
jgi:hypothetical protein